MKKSVFMTAAGAVAVSIAAASGSVAADINRAKFTDDGAAKIPVNWRQWVYVGTPLTPNALNGGEAPFPEFHNVYVEPSAYAHFEKTGEWAEGTQIAKELVLVRESENGNQEDGSAFEVSGRGYFMGDFAGLELTVKDNDRFSDEPGGWAYFSFGHQPEPYNKTAEAFPTEACNACHAASAAYDFTFTQFYPVLRAVKDE
ncbi:MAG: cytochrome P460 family protein [Pseudomonadota bacterium]